MLTSTMRSAYTRCSVNSPVYVSRACKLRRESVVPQALAAESSIWNDISRKAGIDVISGYQVRTIDAPRTVPTATIPTEEVPNSTKRVVLYRDTNGWCPFCQRVWMTLIEKNIDFDTMLINLRDKPEWYPNVASNTQTPAARIDGEYICESLDIMAALEEKFPEPAMIPEDSAAYDAFIDRFSKINMTLFRLVYGQMPDPEPLAELQGFLKYAESVAASHTGDYLFGEFSAAEIATSAFLPLILQVPKGLNIEEYPNLVKVLQALQIRTSYQQTAVDFGTRAMMASRFFSVEKDLDMSSVTEADMVARREVAAKVSENRDALIRTVLHGSGTVNPSGLIHVAGSVYGSHVTEIDGKSVNPFEAEVAAVVEQALQRLCLYLLTGDTGTSPEDKEAIAIQVVTLSYLRNLASSPRDMTANAADQFRLACDAVIRDAYTFPN